MPYPTQRARGHRGTPQRAAEEAGTPPIGQRRADRSVHLIDEMRLSMLLRNFVQVRYLEMDRDDAFFVLM